MSIHNNIIFVGGIHGVGKSTICQKLVSDLNINYLSASEVLKWADLNTDKKNKKVSDIPQTQNRLISGLTNIITQDNYYILDGHFCLFNKEGIVTKIPLETFIAISPIYLIIVIDDIADIVIALEKRDEKAYDFDTLAQMQNLEIEYAHEISQKLNIPLFEFNKNNYALNYESILSQLNESIT